MLKSFLALIIVVIVTSTVAFAGEIFGGLKEKNVAVAKGTKIEVTIEKKTYTAETDEFGSYRLFVPEKGKCVFRVYYQKQEPTFDIFSYDKSTRYDFLLENQDGKYVLRRK